MTVEVCKEDEEGEVEEDEKEKEERVVEEDEKEKEKIVK